MASVVEQLRTFVAPQHDLGDGVTSFLKRAGCPNTAAHSAAVAEVSRQIALSYRADPDAAEAAGWLHDISAVFAPAERIDVAEAIGLEILPEERAFPLIIHQKLSVVLAREVFGVRDPEIVSAVGCHTTLRTGAGLLDKILFVADKIAWDQDGEPPYLNDLLAALERSLDAAALVYLEFLWQRRASLPVLHPWAAEAYGELAAQYGSDSDHP